MRRGEGSDFLGALAQALAQPTAVHKGDNGLLRVITGACGIAQAAHIIIEAFLGIGEDLDKEYPAQHTNRHNGPQMPPDSTREKVHG